MHALGVQPKVIASRTGHADTQVFLKHYIREFEALILFVAAVLAKFPPLPYDVIFISFWSLQPMPANGPLPASRRTSKVVEVVATVIRACRQWLWLIDSQRSHPHPASDRTMFRISPSSRKTDYEGGNYTTMLATRLSYATTVIVDANKARRPLLNAINDGHLPDSRRWEQLDGYRLWHIGWPEWRAHR